MKRIYGEFTLHGRLRASAIRSDSSRFSVSAIADTGEGVAEFLDQRTRTCHGGIYHH